MADTRGFEVVIEVAESLLTKVLKGAWKSAECPDEPGDAGRIPENVDFDETDGLKLGPYDVVDGQAQIPQDQLAATFAPDAGGADLKIGLSLQLEIANPPVPSARLFDMTADVRAKVPIGQVPGSQNLYLLLAGIARDSVRVQLTSGDPLEPKLDLLLHEYVHALYEANGSTFPHTIDRADQNLFSMITVDTHAELYDDESDPRRAIEVSRPDPDHIQVSIPIYLRFYNLRATGLALQLDLADPFGVTTRMILTAPFLHPPGSYTAQFSTPDVTVGLIEPADGVEGVNYQHNKEVLAPFALLGLDLDAQIISNLQTEGTTVARAFGDCTITVPTVGEIESTIGDYFHRELIGRDKIPVWTPEDVPEANFSVTGLEYRVGAEMLVIALNPSPGAAIGAITSFLPGDRDFVVGLSATVVDRAIAQSRDVNDLEDKDLPKRMHQDDHDVDLNSLAVSLVDDAIRVEGEVTVIDAILGSIDVDADFQQDVGLEWRDDAAGTQRIEGVPKGDPEVDPEESVALWVITIIIGVLTGGLAGGLIALLILIIVSAIVDAIATSMGSGIVEDQISGAAVGLSGWPSRLSRIGRVKTRFVDPIGISPSGIELRADVEVISSCEATAIAMADSGSSYASAAGTALVLRAGTVHPAARYRWDPGDGSPSTEERDRPHTYAASGLYLAKHGVAIQQPGGAATRHFAMVRIRNVPPRVEAGADLTVDEGEIVTLSGAFWDVEYSDRHESLWLFGDKQRPEPGALVETNTPPRASGSSVVKHAWCDNGVYVVTLRVRDQNGGVGEDTRVVTVRNVPPTVDTGPPLYAYRCSAILIMARFTDPGWCDRHIGSVDFGDGTPPQIASIRETNAPPAAKGCALASHVYRKRGVFCVSCVVTDDDGASGVGRTSITVTELIGPRFESGFRMLPVGRVGNGWGPYQALSRERAARLAAAKTHAGAATEVALDGALYDCEGCVVRDGERSQRIKVPGGLRAGIGQSLGANPGWDYQFTAWFMVPKANPGFCRLGIDATGGADPDADGIVWAERSVTDEWFQLSERVIASGAAVTVFLEIEAADSPGVAYIDAVNVVAMQRLCDLCPEADSSVPAEPESPEARCVSFEDLRARSKIGVTLSRGGFTFVRGRGTPVVVDEHGAPVGTCKLRIDAVGLHATLPFASRLVTAEIFDSGSRAVEMDALDGKGNIVGRAHRKGDAPGLVKLVIRGTKITAVNFRAEDAGLIRLCVTPERPRAGRKALYAGTTGAGRDTGARSLGISSSGPSEEEAGPSEKGLMGRMNRFGFDDATWAKIDPTFRRWLASTPVASDTLVPVLLSLKGRMGDDAVDPGASQAVRLAEAFEREARSLCSDLARRGGQEIQQLWISRALRVTLPLSELADVLMSPEVLQAILLVRTKIATDEPPGVSE